MYSYDYDRGIDFEMVMFAIMIIVVIICLFAGCSHTIDRNTNERQIIGTVTDKDIKRYGEEDKYLVFIETEDGETEVMEITDSLIYGKFDSSDIYGSLKVNEKYTFTITGSRNEFWSWYPNIQEVEKY